MRRGTQAATHADTGPGGRAHHAGAWGLPGRPSAPPRKRTAEITGSRSHARRRVVVGFRIPPFPSPDAAGTLLALGSGLNGIGLIASARRSFLPRPIRRIIVVPCRRACCGLAKSSIFKTCSQALQGTLCTSIQRSYRCASYKILS